MLALGRRFTRAVAATIGRDECDVWLLGSVVDGGPVACYVKLRILGAREIGVPVMKLSLPEDGIDAAAARSVTLSVIDTIDAVFTVDWPSAEVRGKIGGSKGLQHTVARALGRDHAHLWIAVTDTGRSGCCRICVSLTQNGESLADGRAQLSKAFPAVCTHAGLAKPKERQFHDSVMALSNTSPEQFATHAQNMFTKVRPARKQGRLSCSKAVPFFLKHCLSLRVHEGAGRAAQGLGGRG